MLDVSSRESPDDLPPMPSVESAEALSTVPSTAEVVAEESRPLTPPIVNNLMEMGFTRPQVNVAQERYLVYLFGFISHIIMRQLVELCIPLLLMHNFVSEDEHEPLSWDWSRGSKLDNVF